jgi:hypothetical protein
MARFAWANADEPSGILVAYDRLARREVGICKIFDTLLIPGESRRMIPTQPVIEAGRRQSGPRHPGRTATTGLAAQGTLIDVKPPHRRG